MKNLKKLSVAIMLAALFSTSFTSCIDNEVSPVVEAIYEAQADLLAAEAELLAAEATLHEAQAKLFEAQATAATMAAQTAADIAVAAIAQQEAETDAYIAEEAQNLIEQIAETEQAVEEARLAMLLAQAEFDQELVEIAAAIRAAANIEAGVHAADYATAMAALATLRGKRLTLLGNIAAEELFMQSIVAGSEMTWEVYLANLRRDVLAKKASVVANEEFIERANAYLEGDLEAMKTALADATAAEAAKQDEIDALLAEDAQIDADIATNFDAFITAYDSLLGELNGYKDEVATLEGEIETLTDVTIPDLEAIIADYDGTKTTLEEAVAAVVLRIGAEEDDNHPSNHAAGFGLLGDIETKEGEIDDKTSEIGTLTAAVGVYGTPPSAGDTPRTGTKPQDVLWNADLALLDHEAAFALLTATYNAAAVALANAVDPSVAAGLLTVANDDETDATTDLGTAQTTYDNAFTAFNADPVGSVDTDGAANPGVTVDDLGELGIHSDDPAVTKTYMRVATWKETVLGSGLYIPATFEPTKYTLATLPAAITALKTDVASPNNLTLDAQFSIWEQDGSAVNGDLITVAVLPSVAGGLTLTAAEVVDAVSQVGDVLIDAAYFLEVEADDTSTTNLFNFNVATNELGNDDFSDRAIVGDVTDGDYMPPLVPGDNTASYDITPDFQGEENGGLWVLTAQAKLWNAKLAVAVAQFNYDTAQDDFDALQTTFDEQQELFDNGLATAIDPLGTDITAAEGLVTTAQGLVTTAQGEKSDLQDELNDLNAELGADDYATRDNTDVNNLPLSWDEHANDGLAVGDEIFDYLASANWDDSLTAYAELWNAENALADHIATPLTGAGSYTEQLATAEASVVTKTNLLAEKEILVERWQADVNALTAEYDALIATPLYAAQQVRILEIADEIAVLTAEKDVLTAEKDALAITIAFEGLTTEAAIDQAIIDAQAVIDGAPAILENLAAQIALGEVAVSDIADKIAKLNKDLVDLDAAIAAILVEAAGYLALLQAALAS